MSSRSAAILGLTLLALSAPLSSAHGQDMSSYWPNDDGRSWTYQERYEEYSPAYEANDLVVRLSFAGAAVAPNGIAVQVLREEQLSGPSTILAGRHGGTSALMRNLWKARPDLRDAIARLDAENTVAGGSCPSFAPPNFPCLLLGGELAYRKTAVEVAAWRCDVVDTHSWRWLVSDLTLGNTFSLQLIPDLATDVYLQGTIAAIEDVTVPAGTFTQCLRVDYIVDYGMNACTDESGHDFGTYRSETRGYVHYAPGVGPVQGYEEFIPVVEGVTDCSGGMAVGSVATRITRKLASSTTRIVPATWGRIKTIYR